MSDSISGIPADQLELVTVGIDIGSATSHLAFSRVRLQRVANNLSSRFVVVAREILAESPILLTPFASDGLIDVEVLRDFLEEAYRTAKVRYEDIDSGAVLLTGRALERRNSRAVADLFAELAGGFVCAEAGHLLEAELAAHGSGAIAISEQSDGLLLNVDVGGGTTKFSVIRAGRLLQTAAIAGGGRLLVTDDDGSVERLEWPIVELAAAFGIALDLGVEIGERERDLLAAALAGCIASVILGEPFPLLASESKVDWWLTDPLRLAHPPASVVFSGGVSEYLYRPETETFGDLSLPIATHLRALLKERAPELSIVEPYEGIRATVVGASQFSTQVSGNTITISDPTVLPIRNLPIVRLPKWICDPQTTENEIANALGAAAGRRLTNGPTALLGASMAWAGRPDYRRLSLIASGLLGGVRQSGCDGLVLLCDADVARTLGRIIHDDLGFGGALIALDGLEVGAFDFVDIGTPFEEQQVVPVTVKSLLFS